MEPNLDAIRILKSEFTRRTERNARYSIRAFAKPIGLSHTVLSLVLLGQRTLSERAAEMASERLSLDPRTKTLLRVPVDRPNGRSFNGSTSGSVSGATTRAKSKLAGEYQLILAFALSSVAAMSFVGNEGAYGGDDIGLDLEARYIDKLQDSTNNFFYLNVRILATPLRNQLDQIQVLVVEDELYVEAEGEEQISAALNDPKTMLVLVNRFR